jgi:hypothetical protein
MEQILFLALLAVVGLLRWFSQMAEERRNREAENRSGTPPPNAPIQRAPAETEEERIRRFMEALGVPSAPPNHRGLRAKCCRSTRFQCLAARSLFRPLPPLRPSHLHCPTSRLRSFRQLR